MLGTEIHKGIVSTRLKLLLTVKTIRTNKHVGPFSLFFSSLTCFYPKLSTFNYKVLITESLKRDVLCWYRITLVWTSTRFMYVPFFDSNVTDRTFDFKENVVFNFVEINKLRK